MARPTRMMPNCTRSEIWSAIMPPMVVYRMMTIPAKIRHTFRGMEGIRALMTPPEAAIWEEVRQNSDSTDRIAVKLLENLPNRRPTTSGMVTAMVLRILGAK